MSKNGDKPKEFNLFTVRALQWHKHSDFPEVQKAPMEMALEVCPICKKLGSKHGMLGAEVLCPGDYIMQLNEPGHCQVVSQDLFKLSFKAVEESQ